MRKIPRVTPKTLSELILHLKTHAPSFYSSSRTSTVVPYEKLEASAELFARGMGDKTTWVDLSLLPGKIELSAELVLVTGQVTWSELRAYLNARGRDIMTSPTESLACVLAGLATSATGERSFGHGSLRDQVVSLKYANFNGEIKELHSERPFKSSPALLKYQESYLPYKDFKNAPFPRFEFETDLLIGTEGQLGVVTEATLKTIPLEPLTYFFFKLPRWEESETQHLELARFARARRERIFACELLDSNSLSYLPPQDNPAPGEDLIFFEVRTRDFEALFEELINELPQLNFERAFSLDETRARALRVAVPRAIFESNTRAGVTKKGTDVQVTFKYLPELLAFYRQWSGSDIPYNLFGHFGDAHLHFNFMPTPARAHECDQELAQLYQFVARIEGSPFAEHGIGLLKGAYIRPFYTSAVQEFFAELKREHDPHSQFFPSGFMMSQCT